MLFSRRTFTRFWLVWAGAVLSSGQVRGEEQYLLRYKFAPQQSLTYLSQNDAALTIEYSQAKEEPRHTEMMVRTMRVTAVGPDGTAELELSIDRAYMTATSGGETSTYDSANPAKASPEFAEVNESLRKPTLSRMNPLGKLLPRDGEADAAPVDLVILLPEKPVAVGATWKEKFETGVQVDAKSELLRPVRMERRFALKSVQNGIAEIAMSTECLSPIRDPLQESQVMQRKLGGTLKFDIERGCLIDRELRINDKVVGFQGPGSAIATKALKLDRLLPVEQAGTVDLKKPLLSVQTAFSEAPATK